MPSSNTVLIGLSAIANNWRWLAISWHVLVAAFLVTVFAGWRPSISILGYVLIGPLLSVSLVAWLSGNPFNGAMFAILAVLLTAARPAKTAVRVASTVGVSSGIGLVAFGWTYPHFVTTDSWTTYLYASPFGILPCPTLSVAMGITFLFPDLGTRSRTTSLAGAGLLYGVIGVFRLGVVLDWGLLLASATLAAAMAPHVIRRRSVRANRLERRSWAFAAPATALTRRLSLRPLKREAERRAPMTEHGSRASSVRSASCPPPH
jgi:hypothetical protein